MSFLLDALGKAETDRDQGKIPELKTPAPRRKSPLNSALQIGLLLCLLFASFALGYFARPYLEKKIANVDLADQATISAAGVSKAVETSAASTLVKPTIVAQGDDHSIILSAISFSDKPEIRFVMLNNSVMYEGDELATGERVVRIERHGVVLEKAGEQLRIGLNRSR